MPQCKRKKDGKTEYRSTYRWKDENGVVHQTTTPWMSSKLEADQLANKLSSTKNLPTNRNKQNKKVGVVFDEYIQYVGKEAFDSRLKNKSSVISLYQRLNTINNQYFPKELQNTIVKDVNPSFFRSWLDSLNRKQMSGETLRTYKSAIQKFNKYLADMGYYEDYNTDLEVAIAIGRVELKNKKQGQRKDRRIPSTVDIERLGSYYEENLGVFRNFYYYTFFYFEFYTGCRVSETIALKWCDVDLEPEARVIHIRNAINGKEKRNIALKRTQIGNYATKNETSERDVVIFDMIYQLLVDYKYRYRIHYKLSEEEVEDCFVFPSLRNPRNYASHNHLLEELNRACEGAGIEKLDNGMMRHGCATFLVAPKPDGLGYSPEMVYSQLGHCDSSMINAIYGKLQKDQMARKNKAVFNRIFHPDEDKAYEEEEKELEEMLRRAQGNNKSAESVMKMFRFSRELDRVANSNNKIYYYSPDDEKYIKTMEFEKEYPDIKFIKKK